MIGTKLSHFRIVGKLGEGGMGVVYRAEDEKLRRPVALKILPPELVANEERRLRFLREARTAAALSHPNIAAIHEVDEVGGVVFIAMELVEGKTLRELIAGRPMPIKDALRIAAEVAEGLAHAHHARVIHRDLKPDNVMVRPDQHVKILDFGLAKLVQDVAGADPSDLSKLETISGEVTRAGKVLGTPAYMSPEQARGQPLDARSDIFSFGSTLYEMVTGKAPFRGKTDADTLSAIIRDEPVASSRLNPEVPPKVEEIVGKCLEKHPLDRYQYADELFVDLRRLARGVLSGAEAGSPLKPHRLRWFASAGALGLALVLGAVLWLNPGGWRERLGVDRGPATTESLAVLPFEDLSGEPTQTYFADGMTDALISQLARISALRVISRTSVMRYRGTEKSIPEIARDLDVDAVVEGTVLRSGDRVRITAQLIHAATDRHLWAESYERDLGDVLRLQGEVAGAIAREINVKLTPQEKRLLGTARRVDPEAYELYLKGRFHWNKRAEEELRRGLQYFEQAIERDPDYALAYVGLADSYLVLVDWGYISPDTGMPRARAAALRALEIDESLGEAHASLGIIKIEYDWDWSGAETEFRRSIELNPGYATAHHWYALMLMAMDRREEAIAEATRALQLDPLSLHLHVVVGSAYYYARQYDRAVDECRKALESDPGFLTARWLLSQAFLQKGMAAEAIAELEQVVASSGGSPRFLADLGHAYAVPGRSYEARQVLERLKATSKERYVAPLDVAIIHLGLGDREQTMSWLNRAVEERGSGRAWLLKVNPQLDSLRPDPRFQDLLRRVGLAPATGPSLAPPARGSTF